MLFNTRALLAGAAAAALLLMAAGCATSPEGDKSSAVTTASASTAETHPDLHCQTDDDTGSRLTRHTTCDDDSTDNGAGQAVRSFQNGANTGTKGN